MYAVCLIFELLTALGGMFLVKFSKILLGLNHKSHENVYLVKITNVGSTLTIAVVDHSQQLLNSVSEHGLLSL